MNTIRSTWIGWGSLIIAGGGAYYFAKRSINADRQERHDAEMRRRRLTESLEHSAKPQKSMSQSRGFDVAGSPSSEASHDPAPTRHAPENDSQRVREKSKYEAGEPYRAKKGDRFS